jgi:hypothetical protein
MTLGLQDVSAEDSTVMGPALAVPEDALRRVFADWSGIGSLYRAIAGESSDPPFAREWSADDVERRAMRVLLLKCEPLLSNWPRTTTAWLDQLPMTSRKRRFTSPKPVPRVDWARTRKRGWPPEVFDIRRKHRSSDQVPLAVLGWTLNELAMAIEQAGRLIGSHPKLSELVDRSIAPQIATALSLRDLIDFEDLGVPTMDDLGALRGLGWPWNSVARVAETLSARLRRDGIFQLARDLIRPEGFPDRLFHLAVLGEILHKIDLTGASVNSVRPIGDMTQGPIYEINDVHGRSWDLWWEAQACWSTYEVTNSYKQIASSLRGLDGKAFRPGRLRPDLLLVSAPMHSIAIECKFPYKDPDPGYVAQGAAQAYFYAAQLKSKFPVSSAVVVGPSELVADSTTSEVDGIAVRMDSPLSLATWIGELLTNPDPTRDAEVVVYSSSTGEVVLNRP